MCEVVERMTELTEKALIDVILELDKSEKLSINPSKMLLNQDAVDLMTEEELNKVTTRGLGSLPPARLKELTKELTMRLMGV